MTLDLNYEGFEDLLVKRRDHELGGVQYLFRFKNNFGASVVKTPYSYGAKDDKWELAVIKWRGDDFDLEYDTEITDDVLGWLTDKDVQDLLRRIKEL